MPFISIHSVKWAVRQNAVLANIGSLNRISACSTAQPLNAQFVDVCPSLWQPCIVEGNSQHMRYALMVQDWRSGEVGCFIHEGDFMAKSPVFAKSTDLLDWILGNGYELIEGSTAIKRSLTS